VLARFTSLLRRFGRDESGAFLVLFGVLAIALVATSGAVVDYTSIEQARSRAQNALDAAALGLQPNVFDTTGEWDEDKFVSEAELFLRERLGDTNVTIDVTSAAMNSRNGQLILNARMHVPMSFVSLVGVDEVSATLVSEATRKRLNLEVAMVLDNSGSMASYSRMTELKKAAKSATDILFDDEDTQPNVFISVIPFTQYVNVGTENRWSSWMSQSGASSISHYNFDIDDRDDTAFTQTVNRWDLYDGFNNEPWRGCVEARVTPYDTDDTLPDNAVPDTMFQPVFAPDSSADDYITDTAGSCTRKPPTWKEVWTKSKCGSTSSISWWDYEYCNKSASVSRSGTDVYGANVSSPPTSQPADFSLYSYYNEGSCSSSYSTKKNGNSRDYIMTTTCTYDFSAKEYQQRLCKYDGRSFSGDGANSDCPDTAILPLTNVRQDIKDRIDDMIADGSTNVQQGAIWGVHSLSPTEPLTEGADYDEATSKILIIMTDGENNPNYASYSSSNPYGNSSWMAWGYRSDKRLLTETTNPKDSAASSSQVIAEVNRRTVLSCTTAKAKGMIVYTIGLSAPNNTTKQMLKDCATPSETVDGATRNYWYFPNNSSDLTDVFEEIAEQLSELRLAQ
jgi:Flp pilus assembly protein TadG